MTERLKHVLVVDDEPAICELITMALRDEGIDCESACDGESALTVLKSCAVDLMLLDLKMPGVDGWALLEKGQREITLPPTIVITALTLLPRDLKRLASHPQVKDIITKPFDHDYFVFRVEKTLYLNNSDPTS